MMILIFELFGYFWGLQGLIFEEFVYPRTCPLQPIQNVLSDAVKEIIAIFIKVKEETVNEE